MEAYLAVLLLHAPELGALLDDLSEEVAGTHTAVLVAGVHLLEEGGNGQGDGSSLCQVKRKRVDLDGFRKRLLARFVRLS